MEIVGAEAARKRLPELLERALRLILLGLRGSGRHCWKVDERHRAWRPVPASMLPFGALVAIDSSALIAFLTQTGRDGAGYDPLLQAIALGHCGGLISTLSIGHLLMGPLRQGNEALALHGGAIAMATHNPQLAQTAELPVLTALR
jgi:hypothetical protein